MATYIVLPPQLTRILASPHGKLQETFLAFEAARRVIQTDKDREGKYKTLEHFDADRAEVYRRIHAFLDQYDFEYVKDDDERLATFIHAEYILYRYRLFSCTMKVYVEETSLRVVGLYQRAMAIRDSGPLLRDENTLVPSHWSFFARVGFLVSTCEDSPPREWRMETPLSLLPILCNRIGIQGPTTARLPPEELDVRQSHALKQDSANLRATGQNDTIVPAIGSPRQASQNVAGTTNDAQPPVQTPTGNAPLTQAQNWDNIQRLAAQKVAIRELVAVRDRANALRANATFASPGSDETVTPRTYQQALNNSLGGRSSSIINDLLPGMSHYEPITIPPRPGQGRYCVNRSVAALHARRAEQQAAAQAAENQAAQNQPNRQ